MVITISNQFLTVGINSKGAQLVSIKTVDKVERLWTGDKDVWDYQAPILFPWTGRINDGAFLHNGTEYKAEIHGFLRDTEHSHEKIQNSCVTFTAKSNADTKKLFPFDFIFEQTFSLNGSELTHSVNITNTGTLTMPFGIGYHPGFLCPFDENHKTADYSLVFDTPQSPHEVLMKNGHPTGKTKEYMHNRTDIMLSDTLFEHDSLCFTNLTARTLTLKEHTGSAGIEVNIEGFPYVLLWSMPTMPLRFVCIEPWHTLPDSVDASQEWTQKKNLMHLSSGENFRTQLSVKFLGATH
ncbi:MAG: aldose 1-epimerase family protein [Spirochaetales bacterium]